MGRRHQDAWLAEIRERVRVLREMERDGVGQHSTLPVLTPATYRRVYCSCEGCDVCRWFRDIKHWAQLSPWRDAGPAVPRPSEERPRWGSVADALACYARVRSDGYACRSSHGNVVRVGETGIFGGSGHGKPSATREQRDAEDAAALEPVLSAVPRRALMGLYLRLVGVPRAGVGRDGVGYRTHEPLPWPQIAERLEERLEVVRGEARSAKRFIAVELSARGLLPWPRPSSRIRPAVEARAVELGKRCA